MLAAVSPARTPSPRRRRIEALGLAFALASLPVFVSCSKGGHPDQDATCRKLTDQDPDPDHPLPKGLYAELRNTPVGSINPQSAIIPITFEDGSGGDYRGSHTFTKCEQPDTYYIERLVLVSATGDPVAVALRSGSNYVVTYQNGTSTTATGFSGNAVVFSSTAAQPTLKMSTLIASPNMITLGDRVNVQVTLADDTCGVTQSQWWLTNVVGSSTPIDPTVLAGGSGQASVRLLAKRGAGSYFIEGQVTLKGGRTIQVRRGAAGDSTYKFFDKNGTLLGDSGTPVVSVTVADNPNADKLGPTPLSMEAAPASVSRCQPVNLSLRLFDDKGLPASQQVKVYLGPADNPRLLSTMLTGGDTLSGMITLPSDAPPGVWYGYPEVIRDAAGNESTGTLSGGKFTVSDGSVTSQAVMAATFIVPNPNPVMPPDLAVPSLDGGIIPQPDMASPQFPATLTVVNITPTTAKEGDNITVRMTWNDLAGILK